MPRKAIIDAAGALHHMSVRGIERGKIFRSDYEWMTGPASTTYGQDTTKDDSSPLTKY